MSDRTSAYVPPKPTDAIALFIRTCDRSPATGEPALGVLAPDMTVVMSKPFEPFARQL